MDYYIVRIYQREKGDPGEMVGTVEDAGSSERKAFCSPEELWDILDAGAVHEKERKKGKKLESERR